MAIGKRRLAPCTGMRTRSQRSDWTKRDRDLDMGAAALHSTSYFVQVKPSHNHDMVQQACDTSKMGEMTSDV